jgi:hypothetical protein
MDLMESVIDANLAVASILIDIAKPRPASIHVPSVNFFPESGVSGVGGFGYHVW